MTPKAAVMNSLFTRDSNSRRLWGFVSPGLSSGESNSEDRSSCIVLPGTSVRSDCNFCPAVSDFGRKLTSVRLSDFGRKLTSVRLSDFGLGLCPAVSDFGLVTSVRFRTEVLLSEFIVFKIYIKMIVCVFWIMT